MAKLPVRITDRTNQANTSGGVAHRSIAHFDEIAVIGSTVAANNVSGGVVPLGADEYAAMMISAIGQQPAAWFRAGVGQTVTGSGVSTWADQSGNGRDLLQAVDASRPALQADGSVLFDGVADYLQSTSFTLVAQPVTAYIVCKQVSWTASDNIFDLHASSFTTLSQQTGSPEVRIYAGTATAAANTDWTVGAYKVLACVFNGASSLIQVNLGAATTGNPGSGGMSRITLGASVTPSGYGNIQVLEAILFSTAHDATQRARVIAYLAGRHGIAL